MQRDTEEQSLGGAKADGAPVTKSFVLRPAAPVFDPGLLGPPTRLWEGYCITSSLGRPLGVSKLLAEARLRHHGFSLGELVLMHGPGHRR